MAQNTLLPVVVPVAEKAQVTLTPVALKAKEYLPESARSLVDQLQDQVKGKSFNEVYNLFLNTTRKNLLSIKLKPDAPAPSLRDLVGEVKDATLSGALFNNTLDLSEKAAGGAFGVTELPKGAGPLQRMYGLSTKITGGVYDYANTKYNNAKQAAMDRLRQRMDLTRQRAMNGAGYVQQQLSPIMTRIGATPLVPQFVFKLLRGEYSLGELGLRSGSSSASSKSAEGGVALDGKTTVKVDVVTKQAGTTVASATASDQSSSGHASTYAEAAKGDHPSSYVEAAKIGNTNAQGLGQLGEAGRGVTTTGAEGAEHAESSVPPTDDHHSKKKKSKN